MATAESAELKLNRQELISKIMTNLGKESARVSGEEVAAIVDGIENTSGYYDSQAIAHVATESMRLWAGREQAGMICALKLTQQHLLEFQKVLEKDHAESKARIAQLEKKFEEIEKICDKARIAQLEKKFEEMEKICGEARIAQLEKKFEEMEKKMPMETKETKDEKSQPRKDSHAPKTLTEEEQKEKDAWGHLKDYGEALEELLRMDKERNDPTRFKQRSADIAKSHDVCPEVQALLPQLYANQSGLAGYSKKLNFQPFVEDVKELEEFHKERKSKFDEQVNRIAQDTKGKAIIPNMKGCESKAAFKYTDATGTSWHRCTDIVRATILYDDIQSMYEGLQVVERLHKDKEMEIVEFNDRYQKPTSEGYMDLQLSVRIDRMVCELQMNTKVMAFVKEHAGHRSFEVSRELVAAVKDLDAPRCEEILLWGTGLVGAESVQEIVNEKKKPVLHEAAKNGNANLVSVFLRYRADVNLQNSDGQTALHKAMAGGHERAAWALISAGAEFLADKQGMTPLMEGLLKLRVNSSNESIARAVSTVAQMVDMSELENLNERLEVFVQKRLVQSSDFVLACKDTNLEKVERLFQDWADPNSRSDGLHTVHAALHGGRMDFVPERIHVLRRVLEFRADVDAKSAEGRTALEVALRSSDRRAVEGVAELVRHGARLMNRSVRDFLLPWTPQEVQSAQPQDLVRRFLATWPSFCRRDLFNIVRSFFLKGCLPELWLCRGYEAAKKCHMDEEPRNALALHVANTLAHRGHHWESEAVFAECSPKDLVLSHTLAEASGNICAVAFSGCLLATAGSDQKIRLYDTNKDFVLVKTLADATDHIWCMCWGGDLLAAGGRDKKLWVYDATKDFALIKTLEDAAEPIKSAEFSGQFLAVGGQDKKVRIYDRAQDFRLIETLADATNWIEAVSWSAQLLAVGGQDMMVRIYDSAQDFVLIKSLQDASGIIWCLSWSDHLLAAGSADKQVRIYDSNKDFALSHTLAEASDMIFSVAFSGRLLAAGSQDKQIRLYDAEKDFCLVQTLEGAENTIRSLSWAGRRLAAGSFDAKVRIYDLQDLSIDAPEPWENLARLSVHSEQRGGALVYGAVASQALATGEDGDPLPSLKSAARTVAARLRGLGRSEDAEELLRRFAVEEFVSVKSIEDASKRISSLSWSSQLLAAGSWDGKVRLYDSSKDLIPAKTLEDADMAISALSWSSRLLAASGEDKKVRVYDSAEDFAVVKTLEEAQGMVLAVSWSSQFLAAAGMDKKVRVYDSAKEYAVVKILEDAKGAVFAVSWSSQLLAAGGEDKKVRVYNSAEDFVLVATLQDASGRINPNCLAWRGELLACGENGQTVRVYDAAKEFELVKTIKDATNQIFAVAWSAQFLAVGSTDRMARIYDTAQDFTLVKSIAMPESVFSLCWCGDLLGVGLRNGTLRVLDSRARFGALEEDRLWDAKSTEK